MKALSLGLAGGVLWGGMMGIVTLISVFTGYAGAFLEVMASCYPGFAVTVPGIFLGAAYGFIDGFIGLLILGWLYNLFSGCYGKCKKSG